MPSTPTPAPRLPNAPPIDEVTLLDLQVSGTLPAALSGQYLRIGPTRIDGHGDSGDRAVGEAMVHAVSFGAGRAPAYRNRRLPTDAAPAEFALEPVAGPHGAGPSGAPSRLVTFGTSIFALGDGALAYELSAGLDALRRVDLAGARRGVAAQPKLDPTTGELHLLTSATTLPQLHVRVSRGGLTRTIRPIDNAPNPIHELELTRDDVVLLADGYVGVTGRSAATAAATWFETDTDARHIAGADPHGETLVVYATGPSLERWVLDRRARSVDREVLDGTPQVFASSNRQVAGAARRYLWTVGSGAVYQHELSTGARRSHAFATGRHPGQLVFITDPERSGAEDGGWLVGFVCDETRNESDLVVLDAGATDRPAIATVRIPRRIPNGTDGMWIPRAQI